MKKLIVLLLIFFALNSCEKDAEIIGIDAEKKLSKVDVCHKGEIINISENALKDHLKHGDVQLIDEDGDGYVTLENECLPYGDCDDTDADINPGAEEICDRIDNNCDGKVDQGDYEYLSQVDIIPFLQCDPDWADIRMGTISSPSICEAGTLLTTLTMLLSTVDPLISPAVLNSFLISNDGYFPNTSLINYSAINSFPDSDIIFETRIQNLLVEEMKREVDNGTPIIALIDDGANSIIIFGYENNGTEITDFVYQNTMDCDVLDLKYIDETINMTYFILSNKSN